ncbi:curli assembly protein CsgF [Solirhodobacter olei]|uniref:curli assembly protein CsgF n=1 Tax=Solirhodobacter olei TaxID=2493082 RepID=UPI001F4E08F9|nr:curli assembly protein CsgF [Solirhodobacter olei]
MVRMAVVALLAGFGASPVVAQQLTYTPINPSFGGNPLNGSYLMSLAGAQRNATASDANSSTSSSGTTTGGVGSTSQTDAQLFVQQLQGQLLSALATQVTNAIFGSNPQNSGKVVFGDTTVSFNRTLSSINLSIYDATTGTTTQISVPQLVVN